MHIPTQQTAVHFAKRPLSPRVRKVRRHFPRYLLAVLISAVQLGAQSAAHLTLVKAARLLDPRTGNVLAPAAVLIEGDKIKQVGSLSQVSAPNGGKIIDLQRDVIAGIDRQPHAPVTRRHRAAGS